MSERRLSFQEFCETAQKDIRSYLPDSFRDAAVATADFRKLNQNYVGLTVRRQDQTVVPNINLNAQYEQYMQNGGDLDAVLKRIAEQVQLQPELQTDWLKDYDQVKDRLFVRVSDAEKNKDYLAQVPHKTVDGLAITYHVAFDGVQGINASTVVTNDSLDRYGISAEQLHKDALANSQEMLPSRYTSMAAMMMGIAEGMGMEPDLMEEAPPGVPTLMVLTNSSGVQGAAALFYQDKLDGISSGFHSDFFILPSSVHEVLILPDDGNTDYKDLEMMVQQINKAEVAPEDRLSDHVYHYDAKEHALEKAETHERRMKLKERMSEKADDHGRGSQDGRKSVLQRLNEKKAQVSAQPKKDVHNRAKGMNLD